MFFIQVYNVYQTADANNEVINDSRLANEIYNNQSWAKQYFEEFSDSNLQEYYPYVGYKRKPNYSGRYININQNSIRRTWNPQISSNQNIVKIFCLGGSTMWGTGARDNYTIPSYLSRKLYNLGYPALVTNFGETGYTNTQELLRLLLKLRNGNIPDIVIFYDGVNDVYSTFQNEVAGYPPNAKIRKLEYNSWYHRNDWTNEPSNALKILATNSYTIKLIKHVLSLNTTINNRDEPSLNRGDSINLSNDTVNIYINNIGLVKALENDYGFNSYFFWQPVIYSKQNPSSTENKIIGEYNNGFKGLKEYSDATYRLMHLRTNQSSVYNLYYISNVFDNCNNTIFIDWCHTSDIGNKIVADEITKVIANDNRLKNAKEDYEQPRRLEQV